MQSALTSTPRINDEEFAQIQRLIMDWAGISLGPNKRTLVVGRLSKRLRHYQLDSFSQYLNQRVARDPQEKQVMIDLLTTNETYFFRESAHFDFLTGEALPQMAQRRPLRLWSAACSTGEEAYSLAMVAAGTLPHNDWRILATDINQSVLETARRGLYDIAAADRIPQSYLQSYCLKGVRSQAGLMLIKPELRQRVEFRQLNLHDEQASLGTFDIIFLRNVMIYFDLDTKRRLIARMEQRLNPGGYLILGHAESLNGLDHPLTMRRPSIYQKSVG